MSFGFGFALPHWQTLSGGFSPASLFSAGEQGAWYDPSDASTLFSDTAGTTPSPTPGAGALSVVGLMLDKSQGLVLSANVLSASWTVSAGATASGSSVTLNSASDVFAYQDVMTSGLRYFVTFDYNITSGQTGLYVGSNGGSGDAILSLSGLSGTGTYSGYFRASNTTFIFRDNSGCVASFTNITLRVQQGNHAISYNTTTARPELSARVNLLTYSEQFDNAAWSRDGVTISANTLATTDPLGGNTADKIEEQITSAAHVVYTSGISASAIQYNISVYVKAAERTFARLDCVTTGYTAGTTVILNLNTLATTITNYGATSGTTAQVVTVGNGWYRLVVTFTATAASYFAQIGPAIASTPSTYAGTAGSGIYAWGADLRPANIGTSVPSYQRIADQYTYDSSGFPRYLVFNGTASGMYTPANLNLSGTDKATVFAGVRKQALTTGFVVETSAAAESNNGAFRVGVDSGGIEYFISSRGTVSQQVNIDNAAYLPPVSNVVQSSFDIAAPSVSVRLNGVAVGSNTSSQGTGNFGSYPLNIGARNVSSGTPTFLFNGYIYSLIVVGAASTAAQISSTESWINVKEGTVY